MTGRCSKTGYNRFGDLLLYIINGRVTRRLSRTRRNEIDDTGVVRDENFNAYPFAPLVSKDAGRIKQTVKMRSPQRTLSSISHAS